MEQTLQDLFKRGGCFSELSGITAGELEAMYVLGAAYYEQGRYGDALPMFAWLVANNHREPRYIQALASTNQALGRYRDALQQYAGAVVILVDDPKPIFHSAECLIGLDEMALAGETLQMVMDMCREQGNAPLHAQALALRQALGQRSH